MYDFDHCPDRWNSRSFKYSPSVMKKRMGKDDLWPLWVADMDFMCAPAIIAAVKERADHGLFGYTTMADDDALRGALYRWLKRRFRWDLKKDWILYSPGVVNSIFYLISSLCKPGERVILQNPVYPPFRSVIKDAGLDWVDNRLQLTEEQGQFSYRMDLQDLEEKAADPANRVFLLCSPSNPGGRVWTRDELLQVKDICQRHGVFVISDEIHGDLIYPEYNHTSWGTLGQDEEWAVLVSPSKTFNIPGLNTSFAVIPDQNLRKRFDAAKYRLHGAMENPFGLAAALAAYEKGEDWLEELLVYLKGNYDLVKENLSSPFRLIKQEGTYLAWIDASALGSDEAICSYLYDHRKLGLQMGRDFGPGGEGFVRLNFALPREQLIKVLEKMR